MEGEGRREGGKANDVEEEERKTEQMRDSWRGQTSRHLRERLSILLATTILALHLLFSVPRSPQASWKAKKVADTYIHIHTTKRGITHA